MTNAVFMPYVLQFNRPVIEDRIERLSAWLGISGGFDGFLDYVLALRQELGIAHSISEIGVEDHERFQLMSEMAVVDPTAGSNPVPLDVPSCRRLYEQAHAGSL